MLRPPLLRPPLLRAPLLREGVAGFTVLELLVSISVIGVLVALLLPAVLRVRESARTVTCVNHLRQVGLAMHQHHNWREQLPPAWRVAKRAPTFAYSWASMLLPGLEEDTLLAQLNLDDAPTGVDPSDAVVEFLVCPSDQIEATFALYASADTEYGPPGDVLLSLPTSSYIGVYGTVEADEYYQKLRANTPELGDGAIVFNRRVRLSNLNRGLSQTLLVGERTMSLVPSTWLGVDLRGEDAECRITGAAMTQPNCDTCDECEFSSRHPGGAYFLWADGHVELVADDIDPTLYRQLAQRDPQ
ncbi:DUF1559 family PulG-like putative transporter [Botrimarina colliarenosi]|uniref:DUF1559 family PulG-like putative transporter n=1 Tax=Botrimarina colliarenosi TaxID=2528001 RepID=UPI001E3C410E|nr:DUF1559 domain-containing protein [Botrimarina colliarenosi]